MYYSLRSILKAARIHPFYNSTVEYPPSHDTIIQAIRAESKDDLHLSMFPLLHKQNLYRDIQRLCADQDPKNEFRKNSYISTTGGGSGKSLPMLFLTDIEENRSQRISTSTLIKACKMIEPVDWVLNMQPAGNFYRALDLTTDMIESAGGCVLCAGLVMPHEKSVDACIKYHINVLTGDSSQILNFAHYVASLPPSTRDSMKITKIIYTCEMMPRSRREYLIGIFGVVAFYSLFASAETGPWAVADFGLAGDQTNGECADFIYDSRVMQVEVLSLSSPAVKPESLNLAEEPEMVPEGTAGHLVLTSLQRLRNPLVRYISGDVGSIHALPASASSRLELDMIAHLKVLRLYGRDQRFSFKWLGEYYDFEELSRAMQMESIGVLQWQIILRNDEEWEGSDCCELRLLRSPKGEGMMSDAELVRYLRDVFKLVCVNERLLKVLFVKGVQDFDRSGTSNKVIRFQDRRE